MATFRLYLILFISLLSVALTGHAYEKPLQHSSSHGSRLWFKSLLLAININQQDKKEVTLILHDRAGQLYASEKDLAYWQLKKPLVPPILYKGVAYFSLKNIPGLSYRLDAQHMVLFMTIKPFALKAQRINITRQDIQTGLPKNPGAYLNYDFFLPAVHDDFAANELFAAGVFGPLGVVTGNWVMKQDKQQSDSIRLDTTWTIDEPDQLRSIRFGDDISVPGMWGNASRFGGIQIATNFATRPNFLTYPLPALNGQASLPTVVDVYVNNALVLNQKVQPGPFDINNIPVVNGRGNIELVTKDVLGRERLISVPYYASSNLLKKGLNDYALSLGALRNNYGLASRDYGQSVFFATERHGFTDRFTGEVHSSMSKTIQNIGLGASRGLPFGIIDAAVAVSNHQHYGQGELLQVGLDSQFKGWNLRGRAEWLTQKFSLIGSNSELGEPKFQGQAFIGVPIKNQASIGMSWVTRSYFHKARVNLASINFSHTLFNHYQFIASGITNIGGEHSRAVFLTITRAFGDNKTVSANTSYQNHASQAGFQFNKSPGGQLGYGYYLSGLAGPNGNAQGGVSLDKSYGSYALRTNVQKGNDSYAIDASGGIVSMQHQVFFTRQVNQSFGVVQIPGYKGVGVYVDNQVAAYTNNKGYAVLPNLQSYVTNKVAIHPEKIPLDASIEQSQLTAVPYYHSGVLLHFNIKHQHNGVIKLIQKNGSEVPAGAVVYVDKQQFPVGYNGEVYLTGLKEKNVISAKWDHTQCSATVIYVQHDKPIPYLGRVICH